MAVIVLPWRLGKRRWLMDILASIFAYLVCMTALVAGLVMSFVVFFSAPNSLLQSPRQAAAMLATQGVAGTKISPVRTIAAIEHRNDHSVSAAVAAKTVARMTIAADARQRPLFSQAHLRRLAEKERVKHLAFRESSSFEVRFLHYDD